MSVWDQVNFWCYIATFLVAVFWAGAATERHMRKRDR